MTVIQDPEQIMATGRDAMDKRLASYKRSLDRARTGRASAALVDGVFVEYYGTSTPLAQVATVKTLDPRTLVISPYDHNLIKAIEKAILVADLDLNPSSDGQVIRIHIPALSQERRQHIAKTIRASGEDAKVALRSVRKNLMSELKALEKDKHISQDELKQWQQDVQQLTDEFTKDVQAMTQRKVDEILQPVGR